MSVSIKTPQEIEKMRIAGRLTSEVLDYIGPFVKAGITTNELDKLCHDLIVDVQHAIPAPLNYAPGGHTPYPKSICTSINHQICHGVPSEKVLKNGDIINLDITVIKDGYHGDSSRMFYIGEPSIQARRLCETTYESMWRGIRKVKAGAYLGDVGHAIQSFVEPLGYKRGARVLRSWYRREISRRTASAALWSSQNGIEAGSRHGIHHRTDDQCRKKGDQATGRRIGPS